MFLKLAKFGLRVLSLWQLQTFFLALFFPVNDVNISSNEIPKISFIYRVYRNFDHFSSFWFLRFNKADLALF